MAELTINHDTVSFIIEKARAFEMPEVLPEDEESIPDQTPGRPERARGLSLTRAVETGDLTTLPIDDPAFDEARNQIQAMNIDEQCELIALAWIGRGDFAPEEWSEAVRAAAQAHNNRTAEYLFGMPHLPDHLQAGLDAFDEQAGEITRRTTS